LISTSSVDKIVTLVRSSFNTSLSGMIFLIDALEVQQRGFERIYLGSVVGHTHFSLDLVLGLGVKDFFNVDSISTKTSESMSA